MSAMQSRDQIRAAFAWTRNQNPSKEVVNLAQAAPSMVMTNGLMQTLAFLQSKKHTDLLNTLLEWLARPEILSCSANFHTVMGKLVDASGLRYLRATDEALELLRWVRQFAKARGKE